MLTSRQSALEASSLVVASIVSTAIGVCIVVRCVLVVCKNGAPFFGHTSTECPFLIDRSLAFLRAHTCPTLHIEATLHTP